MSSTLSIIIPTYNAEQWIGAAIDSALAQSYEDIEVLVFDNASTDGTAALLARYDNPRLKIHIATENVGFAGNVTRGIKAATGDYFMVLGADDILEPEFAARAVTLLEANPDAALLHGGAIWINDAGTPIGQFEGEWPAESSGDDAFVLTFTQGFCYSTVVCRTKYVKELGAMDERWGMISDTWLFLKMCLAGKVLFLKTPLVQYRVRDSSLSFELYGDGKMFDDHLDGMNEAFGWNGAQHLRPRMAEARLALAQQAFDSIHMTRMGVGFRGMLRKSLHVVKTAPAILLSPRAWLRFLIALLPKSVIRALRAHRRQLLMQRATSLDAK